MGANLRETSRFKKTSDGVIWLQLLFAAGNDDLDTPRLHVTTLQPCTGRIMATAKNIKHRYVQFAGKRIKEEKRITRERPVVRILEQNTGPSYFR